MSKQLGVTHRCRHTAADAAKQHTLSNKFLARVVPPINRMSVVIIYRDGNNGSNSSKFPTTSTFDARA